MPPASSPPWIVCQIGAREHYAVPRALHRRGVLAALITDFWMPSGHPFGRLPGARRLRDRHHLDLAGARVIAPNWRMFRFEVSNRLRKRSGWNVITARNALFQRQAISYLSSRTDDHGSPVTLFSYSYAALELFRFAKQRGWKTVLGQIDPGPEEERIVTAEQASQPHLGSRWQPVPKEYWEMWRQEVLLADRIVVNSEWSRQCLLKEEVPDGKIEIVPLVYEEQQDDGIWGTGAKKGKAGENFRVLFLGQINLRKGVARLLAAMHLLRDEPVELILAGPSGIDPAAWADLPKVRWVGPVARSEVARLYDEADVFILPTLSDGYALTQLEALSRGLPVIASRRCGETVTPGVNGWLLDDLEPETIATAIRKAREEGPLTNVRAPDFSLMDLAWKLEGRNRTTLF